MDEAEKLMDDWKNQAVVLPEIADDEELPFQEAVMTKINNQELRLLAEKYNSDGKQAMYAYLQSEYGIKNPTCTFKRMKKHPELGYHPEKDRFLFDENSIESEDKVFMTIDELCASNKKVKESPVEQQPDKSKEMEKLIQELIGEYSCAMKSHFRKSGNQMSGKWKSSYASLLA